MRKSKYTGKTYDHNWKVIAVYLAANYSHSTRHNYYRYELARRTSDDACDKIITVSATTMLKIDRGQVSVEDVANRKFAKQSTNRAKTINNVLHRY